MTSRPLRVLMVSEDRHQLRHLSRFINAFGFESIEAADVPSATAAIESADPDFLILGEELRIRGGLELCHLLDERAGTQHTYKFLLVNLADLGDVSEALAAGVDDFLAKPVVHGELLARLRAGARVLEFQRREQEQAGTDSRTGFMNRTEFLRHVADKQHQPDTSNNSLACIIVDLDYFSRVRHLLSELARDSMLRSISQLLAKQVDAPGIVASLGLDRFGILLPGANMEDATRRAESARGQISAIEHSVGDETLTITASCGISILEGPDDTVDLVELAEHALTQAKRSGRNCIVCHGQLDHEEAIWEKLAAPGRLLEKTRARDVMTHCTVAVHVDDALEPAGLLLAQMELLALPVIDAEGLLVGILRAEAIPRIDGGSETLDRSSAQVGSVMDAEVRTVAENSSLDEIVEYFNTTTCDILYVTHENYPAGFVTRETLASLSQPINSGSFISQRPYDQSSRYLLVGPESSL